MKSIEERVAAILKQVFPVIEEKKIPIKTLCMDDIKEWNSMEQINLLVALEEEFKIIIPDDIAIQIISYPAICEYLAGVIKES